MERPSKPFLIKFRLLIEKLALYLGLTSKYGLKGFQKNGFHFEFTPNKEKSHRYWSSISFYEDVKRITLAC